MKKPFLFFILIIIKITLFAQNAHKMLRKGDAEYSNENYKKAEEQYKNAASTEGGGSKAHYNQGNAVYMQKRYDEAIESYNNAAQKTNDADIKSRAAYNKGNAHFWKKEYDKAVNAYKNALRLNPRDEDAKKNLALAKKYLEHQQNKNNNQNKQQQDKNQQEQQQKKQNQQEQQNQNQQNQQNQPEQNVQKSPQQPDNQSGIKKEEAKQMLQIMDEEERKVQERLKKGKPRPSRSAKDW